MSLKLCPFCKGEPEIERTGSRRQSSITRCTMCGAKVEANEVEETTGNQWNTRQYNIYMLDEKFFAGTVLTEQIETAIEVQSFDEAVEKVKQLILKNNREVTILEDSEKWFAFSVKQSCGVSHRGCIKNETLKFL
jgi:hypothetical protein